MLVAHSCSWFLTVKNLSSNLNIIKLNRYKLVIKINKFWNNLMQFRLSNNHCFWWNYKAFQLLNRDKIWTKHKDLVQRGYSRKTMILNHYVFHSKSWSSSILAIDANKSLVGKVPDAGKGWGQKEKRESEDTMAGWCQQFNGHEFGQIPGNGEGQGGLVCCSPWDHQWSDTTGRLTNSNNNGFHITYKPTYDTHIDKLMFR